MAAAAAEDRAFRYERKFLVDELGPREVESVVRLHPALFREVFPPRRVNNIYLDTFDASSYVANVDGLVERVKVRIRWYGELFGRIERPVLEFKRKRGLLGQKEAYPLAPLTLEAGFGLDTLRAVLAASEVPGSVRESVKRLAPLLVNRYRRRYLLSADGRVRLTLDTEREFFAVGPRNNTFCLKLRNLRSSIVELKHDPRWSERAAEIATLFPFRLTKSSKYVQGLDLLAAGS